MDVLQLPVEHSATEYFANSNPDGETPLEEFWRVRAKLLQTCQRFGRTGPEDGWDESISFWLVEDQYNSDLYQYMAIHKATAVSPDWLRSVVKVLAVHRGWAISVATELGWVIIFADRIVVHGEQFNNCDCVESVLHELAKDAAESPR